MENLAVRAEEVWREGRSDAPTEAYRFLVEIEGRVEVVQVERLRVHAAHGVEVVVRPHRPASLAGGNEEV